jgi:hypothetical protein
MIKALTLIFILSAISLFHPLPLDAYQRERAGRPTASKTPIRLVLSAARSRLRYGQPIELTAYLENATEDKVYMVGKGLMFGVISPYQNLLLNGGAGCPDFSITSTWEVAKLTTEEVEKSYVVLAPGRIYGLKSELGCEMGPGRYRLTVTYRDDFAQVWGMNKNIRPKHPVWTETITSNPVVITVDP